MKHNKIFSVSLKMVVGSLAASAVGCASTDKSDMDSFFPSSETQHIQQMCTAQAAAGAHADSTLQPMHFDGDKLNSLGEAKLDLLMKDEDGDRPVVVYMNLSRDDADLQGRRDAVTTYLEDRGTDKDKIEFKLGTNPAVTSMSGEHLSRLPRTETEGDAAGASAAQPASPTAK